MRRAVGGALACALAMAVAAAPSQARPHPHALIAFLPSAPAPELPLLDEFANRMGGIGLTSPTVGGFKKRQMALDMGQGTRIPTRLYAKRIGALRLERAGGWHLSQWGIAQRRAEKAPGDLVPGLLASTLQAAGRRVAYVGISRQFALGAIVAANERGQVQAASLGPAASVGSRAAGALGTDDLVVADLPPGAQGLAALDGLLRARGNDGFVYVVRSPGPEKLQLLPSAVAAPGLHGQLRSATTRRTGLVAATDVAPTILQRLGVAVPEKMQGEPITARGSEDPSALRAMAGRLVVVASRRGDCLRWVLGAWLVLVAAAWLVARRRGVRAAVRVALLGALWLPGVALANAALGPGRVVEAAILSLGSLVLGAITDRLVAWPFAPAVPAAIVFAAHAVDLARGSPLIGESIAGPNPAGGARFFGIGNELETILSFLVLIGTAAALAFAARRASAPRAPVVFAAAAVVAAGVMGAGRLGADVGAVITLGAGGAAAVLASLEQRPSRRAVALAIAAPVAAVGALIVLDLATGGGAHLTRSVLHAHGSGDLEDVVRRRFRGSYNGLRHPGQAVTFVVALAIVVWLAARRDRVLAPLRDAPGGYALRAGLVGAFVAVVVGAISNDSGPLILEIGAVLLVLGAGYAASRPLTQAR